VFLLFGEKKIVGKESYEIFRYIDCKNVTFLGF